MMPYLTSLLARLKVVRSRAMLRVSAHPELSLGCALALVIATVSMFCGLTRGVSELRQHLGGEYFNIARAIVDGRGFSDPFGERTGPTAWMPPLYPMLLASILFITKTRAMTASIVVVMTDCSFVVVGVSLYRLARQRRLRLSPLFVVALYLAWLVVFTYWTFYLTQDIWILGLGALCVLICVHREYSTRVTPPHIWGALTGALALASPVLASSAAVMMMAALVRRRARWTQWLQAFALAAAIAAPWAVRNATVFHGFIPVKSNLYYDLYEANFSDSDGLWDLESMSLHPYSSPVARFRYASEGEAEYLASYKQRFWTSVSARPGEYARKVIRRLVAETVLYPPVLPSERGARLWVTQIVYACPFICTLLALAIPSPNRPLAAACAGFAATYLASYALVGFYVRYLLVITPTLLLLCFLGLDALAWWLLGSSRRRADAATIDTASP